MLLLIPTTQREKKSTPTTAISYFEICKSKQTNPKCTHRGRRRRRLHAAKHDARSLSVVVWRGSCHYDSSLPSQWRCTSPPPPTTPSNFQQVWSDHPGSAQLSYQPSTLARLPNTTTTSPRPLELLCLPLVELSLVVGMDEELWCFIYCKPLL